MATISTGILGDANLINLKPILVSDIRPEVFDFFVLEEDVVQCFKTVRDQVIFTNKRIFVVNVQGISPRTS